MAKSKGDIKIRVEDYLALRRDSERLDWLASQVNATLAAGWQLLDVSIPGDNLRAAIDAAMKGGE